MSKTWWGHYIIVDKGEEYIRFEDYLELSSRIVKAIEFIEEDKLERTDIPALELILKIRKDKILNILKGGNNEKNKN